MPVIETAISALAAKTAPIAISRVIILNLESCDATTRMNFYTYAMGLCAGVDGKMGQVSESIFIIAPRNITLSGALTSGESQADPLMQARSV